MSQNVHNGNHDHANYSQKVDAIITDCLSVCLSVCLSKFYSPAYIMQLLFLKRLNKRNAYFSINKIKQSYKEHRNNNNINYSFYCPS